MIKNARIEKAMTELEISIINFRYDFEKKIYLKLLDDNGVDNIVLILNEFNDKVQVLKNKLEAEQKKIANMPVFDKRKTL